MKQNRLIRKFNKQAKIYENNRNNSTLVQWRNRIIPDATGDVLEVGVGVGANFPYYARDHVTITAVDFSEEMLKRAKRRATNLQMAVHFLQEDIHYLQFKSNSFDSIVSTLTVCGYPDPIQTLTMFTNWCKPDGTILFMEHGLSSNRLLSLSQKVINPLFLKIAGCHCNRNIPELIEAAPMEITHIEQYWSDMISLIWAKPVK